MENTQNQCQLIMAHMNRYGYITDDDARDYYGIKRLAACIFTLRSRGHKIVSVMKKGVNRYGKTVRYAEYFIEK